MFGFSIYLDKDINDQTREYVKKMADSGFTGVFTSAHVPEDDHNKYLKRLEDLGALCKEYDLGLMVDISGDTLEELGVSYTNLMKLKEMNVTGLRADYGVPFKAIAAMSRNMRIALNASTLSQEEVDILKDYGGYFSNLEAWHNFYPRPETGLGRTFFKDKNKWLKSLGLEVMAFVPGDIGHRGPLFEGLPTLEDQRDKNIFASTLELLKVYKLDRVYIGDERISDNQMEHFKAYIKDGVYILHSTIKDEYKDLEILKNIQTNRSDGAKLVIRSRESRIDYDMKVDPNNCIDRLAGSITLDNKLYGRYEGELQVTRVDLPQDDKVNVIGKVDNGDIQVIKYISAGDKFKLIERK